MKHPRAELIAEKTADMTKDVWCWCLVLPDESPAWHITNLVILCDHQNNAPFAVGPKPTEPPQKMCTLAGVSFPVPVTKDYWNNNLGAIARGFDGCTFFFKNKEHANAAEKAMRIALEQAIKEAK